jgi:hypothetical protein
MVTGMKSPKSVRAAGVLLWSSLFVELVEDTYIYIKAYGPKFHSMEMLITALAYAIVSLLIVYIYRGKNWSRLVYLFLFILTEVAPYISDLRHTIYPIHYHVSTLAQITLTTAAYLYLFNKESSEWFSSNRKGNVLETAV